MLLLPMKHGADGSIPIQFNRLGTSAEKKTAGCVCVVWVQAAARACVCQNHRACKTSGLQKRPLRRYVLDTTRVVGRG